MSRERKQGLLFCLPVAAGVRICSGDLVSVNAEGYVVPASDIAYNTFLGVARAACNNAGGSNGALIAEGYLKGIFSFSAPGATIADMMKDVYAVDKGTVGLGVVAQPVNITGVHIREYSQGGLYTLAFNSESSLSYEKGISVRVRSGGYFTLFSKNGGSISVHVDSTNLPNTDREEAVQLRHVKVGRILEVPYPGTAFVELCT